MWCLELCVRLGDALFARNVIFPELKRRPNVYCHLRETVKDEPLARDPDQPSDGGVLRTSSTVLDGLCHNESTSAGWFVNLNSGSRQCLDSLEEWFKIVE